MNNIKLMNIQHCYINGKQATKFDLYSLVNNTWVFSYSDYIFGTFKRQSTILQKHIAFNNC